ncbi:MAG: oligosaccharide flippase family protein [Bacteroidota bacterium]
MNSIKKLAGHFAIYGVSSIIGRLLNYLLVPIHSRIFHPAEYGVVGEMYAYVSLLYVILMFGMETAFFRFAEREKDLHKVYSTTLTSIFTVCALFVILMLSFSGSIANLLNYPGHSDYIIWFALVIALDAFSSIPFALLRQQNKAKRFATIKMLNIGMNVGLNLFFLLLCPWLLKNEILTGIISLIYHPSVGVGYIFIANLIASLFTIVLLLPDILSFSFKFDYKLFRTMFKYAFPLLIFGLAGIVNETFDRILIKYLSPKEIASSQVGIYSACYKISIMITIFIQAFKYAAEPFFFSQAKYANAQKTYADVMKYFVIACSFMFLGITLMMDLVKYFVGKEFYEGLKIVPILLLANIFLGIFYNLSVWYKLTDKTTYGAYISIGGAILTLVLNFILIPIIGYMGAAWTTFICYLSMMVISFIIGQKHYRIPYEVFKLLFYILLSVSFYFFSLWYAQFLHHIALKLLLNGILLIIYCSIIWYIERRNIYQLIHLK